MATLGDRVNAALTTLDKVPTEARTTDWGFAWGAARFADRKLKDRAFTPCEVFLRQAERYIKRQGLTN